MPNIEVRIEPLEPMLFGDNRSARAGEDHALADQDPSPATLYGAVGGRIAAALGARPRTDRWAPAEPVLGELATSLDEENEKQSQLLGYTLCDAGGETWFPRPLHLRVRRFGDCLDPLDLLAPRSPEPGTVTSLGPLARLAPAPGSRAGYKKDEAEEPLWIDEALLRVCLTGGKVPDSARAVDSERFFRQEQRVGLTLSNKTNAAVESKLFGRPYRRFTGRVSPDEPGWSSAGFRAWFEVLRLGEGEPECWSGEGFLGGDRGRARFAFESGGGEPLAGLREAVLAAGDDEKSTGFLTYLLTPAVAEPGWPHREGRPPVAVATGKPGYASGWNAVARPSGPRPIRVLVPAGSVFFYEWPPGTDAEARRRLLADLWLTPLNRAFGAAGFGRVLPGVWRSSR